MILEDVTPDGPADDAGFKPGDVLVGIDGKTMTDPRRMGVDIAHRRIGDTINFNLWRGNQKLTTPVAVRERLDDPQRFAHILQQESNPVRQLGILALDVTDKLAPMLPSLRRPAGVAVAATIKGIPGPAAEFEPGDLISSVNGEPALNVAGVRAILDKLESGDAVVVQVQREDDLLLVAFEMP